MAATKAPDSADRQRFLALEGIGKRYGQVTALADVGFEIGRGEFVTLLGPSGSGKTTTLMTIAGFVEPSAGRIRRDGVDISALPPEKRNFGMVFQGYALFPHMTVRGNIAYPLKIRRWPKARREAAIERVLAQVDLTDFADRKPSQLSGGQQQRVALARALVFDPDVLLLDEPLAALDKNLRKQLQSELKKLHRDVGKTFIFVTHDQEEALALSDRIAIFNKGRLEQVDAPEVIYNRPTNQFVATFLGETNLLPADLLAEHGAAVAGLRPGGLVSVRPELVTVSATPPGEGVVSLPATVSERLFQGSQVQLSLAGPAGLPLIGRVRADDEALLAVTGRGEACWVSWPVGAGVPLHDA
ncbi:ABC transporter ATP-binding protein [Aquibium sp. A9E412]|uniref:ABC transporter ATP-binding protein n=1 Tax=Aquibium sp. A9E412 TaxID=2976767 RepID=UPI0025AECEBD|nr:ABC transporter ATP-binding protein [Aquibium sp. A9E412]MDN2565602.1 ABC transporter ATP-binding protein [Aquibium sp. A9E412]